MLARLLRCAVVGLDGALVGIDVGQGVPERTIIGLPDPAVQKSREPVRAASCNSEANFPLTRVTAYLAPADIRKERPAYRSRWAACSPPVRSWPNSIGCW